MNYQKACEILEISQKYTDDCVKKAYFRQALKYHPDKYKLDNGEKFREIKEAYDFLQSGNPFNVDSNDSTKNNAEIIDYKELIKMCIKYFSPETNWDDLFMDTSFHGIINDCKNISFKIFEKLNKDKAEQVYNFISNYNSILNIDEELVAKFKSCLQEKMVYDNVIILNPSLNDLLQDNIFKLNIEDKEFYIPLWHHELHFSLHDKYLIVKMEPEITDNYWIDDRNNIYKQEEVCLYTLLQNGFHEVYVGEKTFKIPAKELKITKEKQIYHIPEKGILKINEKHTYDTTLRGDIYIEVKLDYPKPSVYR